MFIKVTKKINNKKIILRKKDVSLVVENSDNSVTIHCGKVAFTVKESIEEVYDMLAKK